METAESKPRSSARRRYAPIWASVAVRAPRAKLGRRRPNLMLRAARGGLALRLRLDSESGGVRPVPLLFLERAVVSPPGLLFFERFVAIFLTLRLGLFAASRLIGGRLLSWRRRRSSRRRARGGARRR